MNTVGVLLAVVACCSVLVSAGPFGGRKHLTEEQRDAFFEELISDLSSEDQQTARNLREQMQELIGDNNFRDLTDTIKDQIKSLNDQLMDLLPERPRRGHGPRRDRLSPEEREARFEEAISSLSDEDKAAAREIKEEMKELIGDGDIRDLDDDTRAQLRDLREQLSDIMPERDEERRMFRREPKTPEERQERFEELISSLSEEDQAAARAIHDQIAALMGDRSPRDLSDDERTQMRELCNSLKEIIGERRHHFKEMSPEERDAHFEEMISGLPAETQEAARSIRDQIKALIGDNNPHDLDDNIREQFRELHQQLRRLLPRRSRGHRNRQRNGRN